MSKATAIAHPIQGLIKYHGLRDDKLRLPFHDSISVCTAPYQTQTTVEVRSDLAQDVFEIDGEIAVGRAYERAALIVAFLRKLANTDAHVYMRSENNFTSNIGLGASASGFAALTMAAANAYGLSLTIHELSAIARVGAGSASRALAGGFAHWYAGNDHESSYAEMIANKSNLDMRMVIGVIPVFKQTENAHADAAMSPFMACRIAYAKAILDDLRAAAIEGDFTTVGALAEKDTLSLHAATMTGGSNHIYWQPETVAIFHEVRQMRQDGIEAYFSVDTGATVYINCMPDDVATVEERIKALGVETAVAEVGGAARLVDDHLL